MLNRGGFRRTRVDAAARLAGAGGHAVMDHCGCSRDGSSGYAGGRADRWVAGVGCVAFLARSPRGCDAPPGGHTRPGVRSPHWLGRLEGAMHLRRSTRGVASPPRRRHSAAGQPRRPLTRGSSARPAPRHRVGRRARVSRRQPAACSLSAERRARRRRARHGSRRRSSRCPRAHHSRRRDSRTPARRRP